MALSIPFLPPVNKPGQAADMPVVLWDDFVCTSVSNTADEGNWLETSAGIAVPLAEVNGIMSLTSDTTTEKGIYTNGAPFQLTAGSKLQFTCRISNEDVDATKWLVGLVTANDTAPAGGVVSHVGFRDIVGTGGAINAVSEASSTETTTACSQTFASDGDYRVLSFEYDGNGNIRYFVDGAKVATHTTNIPTGVALDVAFTVLGVGGANEVMNVDYVLVVGDRQ